MKKTCIIIIALILALSFYNCVEPENGSVTVYNRHSSNTITKITEDNNFFGVSVVSSVYPGSSATIVRDRDDSGIKKYYVWVGTTLIGSVYSEAGKYKSYYYNSNGTFTESSSY